MIATRTHCRWCDDMDRGCPLHPRDPRTVRWDGRVRRYVPRYPCPGPPYCGCTHGPDKLSCHDPQCPARAGAQMVEAR